MPRMPTTPPPRMHSPLGTHAPPKWILRDAVNKRAVRILLECILVFYRFNAKYERFMQRNVPIILDLLLQSNSIPKKPLLSNTFWNKTSISVIDKILAI